MGNEQKQTGWVPIPPFIVQADDPPVAINFDGAGFRTVKLALVNKGATDAYGAHEDDTGPTAIEVLVGEEIPTKVGPMPPAALPYHLWASAPVDVLVQPFGLVAGEPEILEI